MLQQNLLTQVKIDDLPEGCQDIAQVIGLKIVIDLIDYAGGSSLYFPSKSSVVKNARNRMIKQNFDGTNYKQLSKKFGMSDVQIRKILN